MPSPSLVDTAAERNLGTFPNPEQRDGAPQQSGQGIGNPTVEASVKRIRRWLAKRLRFVLD